MDLLIRARRRSATVRPTSVEPVNDTTRTSSLASVGLAYVAAAAGDEIDDAGGDPGVFENSDEIHGRQRGKRRRLEDDGVSTDERRNDLPRWNRHREIPWCDDRATPSGWRTDIANLSRSSDGTVWPYCRRPLAGHEVRHVDRFLNVAARFLENFAHFARHVARKRLFALCEELCGAKQNLGTTGRRDEAPMRRRPAGGSNRDLNVFARGALEQADEICVFAGLRFSKSSPETDETHEPSIKL